MWMGVILAIGGGVHLGLDVLDGGGGRWEIGIHATQVLAGLLISWSAEGRRVEADQRGLVVHRSPRRPRIIPWAEVAEVRADVPGVWGTKLVVVTQDGEVVDLPLASTEPGPAAAWRRHTEIQDA